MANKNEKSENIRQYAIAAMHGLMVHNGVQTPHEEEATDDADEQAKRYAKAAFRIAIAMEEEAERVAPITPEEGE